MHPDNPISVIPPHQRTTFHFLGWCLLLLEMAPIRPGQVFTYDHPFPCREALVPVDRARLELEIMAIGEGLVEGGADN